MIGFKSERPSASSVVYWRVESEERGRRGKEEVAVGEIGREVVEMGGDVMVGDVLDG